MNEDDDPVQGLGRAQSLPTNYTSFFPSFRNRRHHANHAHSPSPSGPTIYDENLVSRPIFEHSDTCFAEHYPEEYMINPAQASLDPDDLKDPYLFPRLAKNEVQRLTSLWYVFISSLDRNSDTQSLNLEGITQRKLWRTNIYSIKFKMLSTSSTN